jgi:ketosteroid isomerase-like protein
MARYFGGRMAQDTEQSIREWFRIMERCFQSLDYATARKLMAEDVIAFSMRTNVMTGIDALVTQQWAVNWPNLRDFTFSFDQLHWGTSGDLAWAVITSNSTGFHPDGTSFVRPGRTTVIFERREGTWLAIHTHYSLAPGTPPTTHRPGA